jgi:hypothetical protein
MSTLPPAAFMDVTKNVCRLPSFINGVLFKKLEKEGSGVVTKDDFLRFWISESLVEADQNVRLFAVLKQPGKNHLTQVRNPVFNTVGRVFGPAYRFATSLKINAQLAFLQSD